MCAVSSTDNAADAAKGYDALMYLIEQLEWRGPNGKVQGHVVLPRELALTLFAAIDHLHSVCESHKEQIKRLETRVRNLRHE